MNVNKVSRSEVVLLNRNANNSTGAQNTRLEKNIAPNSSFDECNLRQLLSKISFHSAQLSEQSVSKGVKSLVFLVTCFISKF